MPLQNIISSWNQPIYHINIILLFSQMLWTKKICFVLIKLLTNFWFIVRKVRKNMIKILPFPFTFNKIEKKKRISKTFFNTTPLKCIKTDPFFVSWPRK